MRYHYTPTGMAKMKRAGNSKSWRGCRATGTLTHCYWEYKGVEPLWKTTWQYLLKLNIGLSYDPKFRSSQRWRQSQRNQLEIVKHLGSAVAEEGVVLKHGEACRCRRGQPIGAMAFLEGMQPRQTWGPLSNFLLLFHWKPERKGACW